MYSPLQLAAKYLRYLFTASNGKGHGMHSPFIFEFITKLMNDTMQYPAYTQVEALRRQLRKENAVLVVEDMGAGSGHRQSSRRKVKDIARHAAKPARYGQLLYRMVRHYQPERVMELGTSLGLTTAYLALAQPSAPVITMEGAKAVAAKAKENLQWLGAGNVTLVEGNFDDTLAPVLQQQGRLDFAFIDGNHRLEPTVRYFEQMLPCLHAGSILVFDDIHWSREMEQAWHTIQAHDAVRCTLDLFFIGIVFFRKEFYEKQHFTIRF